MIVIGKSSTQFSALHAWNPLVVELWHFFLQKTEGLLWEECFCKASYVAPPSFFPSTPHSVFPCIALAGIIPWRHKIWPSEQKGVGTQPPICKELRYMAMISVYWKQGQLRNVEWKVHKGVHINFMPNDTVTSCVVSSQWYHTLSCPNKRICNFHVLIWNLLCCY